MSSNELDMDRVLHCEIVHVGCPSCNKTGLDVRCPVCHGKGSVPSNRYSKVKPKMDVYGNVKNEGG